METTLRPWPILITSTYCISLESPTVLTLRSASSAHTQGGYPSDSCLGFGMGYAAIALNGSFHSELQKIQAPPDVQKREVSRSARSIHTNLLSNRRLPGDLPVNQFAPYRRAWETKKGCIRMSSHPTRTRKVELALRQPTDTKTPNLLRYDTRRKRRDSVSSKIVLGSVDSLLLLNVISDLSRRETSRLGTVEPVWPASRFARLVMDAAAR